MPRTGRGGSRTGMGTVGQGYGNRSDLALPAPPNQAAPGQEYGTAGQQEARMRQIPVAPPPGPGGPPTVPPGMGVGAPPPAGAPPLGAPGMGFPEAPGGTAATPPGGMPPIPEGGILNQPTNRPNEPLTAGLPIGPGPGTEALVNGWGTGTQGGGEQTTADLLRGLATRPGAGSTLAAMANLAQTRLTS